MFPKILIADIKNFPIKENIGFISRHLEALGVYIKELMKNFEGHKLLYSYFDQLASGLVYELYFLDDVKAASKEILPHLGELASITDEMAEEEKLAVIQHEFDRLYDPRHPVRNHLDTQDSVEVVRTIRKTLKR